VLHPVLGTIDASAPGDWQGTLRFAERDVDVELSIERGAVPEETVTALLARLEKLDELDAVARAALASNASGDDEDAATLVYVDHHRDELPDSDLEALFGSADRDRVDVSRVLSKLELVRIGLYPEDADYHFLLDYSLGREISDYVLCAVFDSAGKLHEIELES